MSKERIIFLVVCLVCLAVAGIAGTSLVLYEQGKWTISDWIQFFGLNASTPVQFLLGGIVGLVFGFLGGALVGHWFWPNTPKER